MFTQTMKINQCKSRKYSLYTKETLSESDSQSTFSRQEKVLQTKFGEAYLLINYFLK